MVRTRRRRPRLRTAVWVPIVVVLLVAAGALGTDTAIAIRAEHSFARALMTYSHASGGPGLRYEPEVTISGFPAYRSVESGHYSSIGITARAVAVVGSGTCTDANPCHADLRARMSNVRADAGHLFRPGTQLRWTRTAASVTLDSVAVGRLLGIDDLTVNTPAPRGEAGGEGPQDGLLSRTDGVLLTGSVSPGPGRPTEKYSVVVDLSIADIGNFEKRMRITATDFYDGPAEHSDNRPSPVDRAAVLARFSATLPWLPMPWASFVTGARSSGSDLMLEGETAGVDGGFENFLIAPSDVHVMYLKDQPR